MATTKNTLHTLIIRDHINGTERIIDALRSLTQPIFNIILKDSISDGLDYIKRHSFESKRIDIALFSLRIFDESSLQFFEQISNLAPWLPVILLIEKVSDIVQKSGQEYLIYSELEPKYLTQAIRFTIDRKQLAEDLKESKERYILIAQGSRDGIWDWDVLTGDTYYSPRWAEIIQLKQDEVKLDHNEWIDRVHPDDIQLVRSTLQEHQENRTDFFECEHRIQRKDGTYVWVHAQGLALRDQEGMAYRIAGSFSNISTQKEVEQKVRHETLHDELTGLPNRALFIDRLKNALERSKRLRESGFAILLFDLDRFKLINDSLGHNFGDKLLVKVAEILKTYLRACDSAARLSGDEFTILLENIHEAAEAILIADRIQQAIQTPIRLNNYNIVISASIGIVLSDLSYTSPEDILRDADIGMNHAKLRGKSCHAVFRQSMYKRSMMRLELENELREILSTPESCKENLFVVFQPIIASHSEQILGFETLARWSHPEHGTIPPNEFIPLAEETGLIHPLGLWVLEEACKQVRIWQDKGLSSSTNPLSISVNISGKQFLRPDLVEQIETIIQKNRISPKNLNLEITESLLVEDDDIIVNAMERLREIGVSLQIDDFGRGYSSFSHLEHIPVNTLKIDSLFIQRIGENKNSAEIIRSIVGLAKSLGFSVIAEGVETDNQFQQLKQLDCHFVQGYYFSRAVRGEETEKLIIQNRKLNAS